MTPTSLRLAFPLVARRYVPLLAGSAAALSFAWVVPTCAWITAYRDELQQRVSYRDARK